MLEQFSGIEIGVGVAGLILIINALAIISSSKYFSFFFKTHFIEPASEEGKYRVREKLNKDYHAQRYGLSAVMILLGVAAIAWSLGLDFIL